VRRTAPVLACVAVVVLAGCSSSSSGNSAAPKLTSCAPSSASASASPSTAPAVAWTTSVPTVSGAFGDKPALSFTGAAPTDLLCGVISEGTGPVVLKGQLMVADYLGQIWGGKVFDNSYDRKGSSGFQIGAGQVIPGWDNTLVGQKVGSRVLISVPPASGYGAAGSSDGSIKGTDTIVFVVDIVAAYSADAKSGVASTPAAAAPKGITVTGAVGTKPTIVIAKGTAEPAKQVTTVLDKGAGAPLPDGLAIVQYQAVGWTGVAAGSTWTAGAVQGVPVTKGGTSSPFDALAGVPVGSRVLLELPKASSGGPYAVVVDVIAHAPTAKESLAG
jgi:peptidylprolyl isomerase